MKKVAAGDTYDLLVVIFVDLGSGTTTLHFVGNLSEEVAADLGGVKHSDEFVYNNIMSRKKDVIPLITNIIEKQKS